MVNSDQTLTSPVVGVEDEKERLLGLTIIWHPDHDRIGEQFICNMRAPIEVGRFMPTFSKPNENGLPLGHPAVSRNPIRIIRDSEDGLIVHLPVSKMVVELNGTEAAVSCHLSSEQIGAGQILSLGRTILLCIHWINCIPKNNYIDGLLGVGSAAIKLRDQINQVARKELSVLLLGETGTGKEIAAQAIHMLSKRCASRLVSVNMAALNESLASADLFGAAKGAYTGSQSTRRGFFSEAANSTLFLDEIGNAPASVQPMLLRVLENGDYRPVGAQNDEQSTARVIAATDQNLESNAFNQPLLRRLESCVIQLPPLRNRREDIGVLIVHILKTCPTNCSENDPIYNLPTSLISELARHNWPGNIRQLSHVVQRAVLVMQAGEVPRLSNLVKTPAETSSPPTSKINAKISSVESSKLVRKNLNDVSETDVIEALENNGWYIQAAADELGISRPSMYKLIDSNKQIRRIEQISEDEVRRAIMKSGGNLAACASLLKTPSEALRRHLRGVTMLTSELQRHIQDQRGKA